ncbi:MAG: hypothetical protein FWE16_04345 [Firmicutes bacterium]|nr:hypothetical protein [Bacillota bacterium]
MDEFDIITLTPDMSVVWGNLLKKLRERKEEMLYSICANHADVEFLYDSIIAYIDNNAFAKILHDKRTLIDSIIGESILMIINKKESIITNEKVAKLKKLFGDNLVILGGSS